MGQRGLAYGALMKGLLRLEGWWSAAAGTSREMGGIYRSILSFIEKGEGAVGTLVR
jgi:hypothetical protein